MDIFQLSYFLTQACLGEITQNFRKIYFTIKGNEIKSHFFLENYDDDELEDIFNEILTTFEMLIEDDEAYAQYDVYSEIITGKDKYLQKDDFDTVVCVFSRKEV